MNEAQGRSRSDTTKNVRRRTNIKGAAWSLPVIAAAVAVSEQVACGDLGCIRVVTLAAFAAPNTFMPKINVQLVNVDGTNGPIGHPVTFTVLSGDAEYQKPGTGPSSSYVDSSLFGGWAWSEWLMNGAVPGPVTIQASAPGYGTVTLRISSRPGPARTAPSAS